MSENLNKYLIQNNKLLDFASVSNALSTKEIVLIENSEDEI
jgi:hypothetical protein